MVAWVDGLAIAVGGMSLLLVALIAWRGRRSTAAILLGAWIGLLAMGYIVNAVGKLAFGFGPYESAYATLLFLLGRPFLLVAFGLTYMRSVLSPPLRGAVALLVGAAVLNVGSLVVRPDLYVLEGGVPTRFASTLGSLFLLPASYVALVGILGYRWAKAPPGTYRGQLLWGLLPFLFYTIHDGIGFALIPSLLGPRASGVVPFWSLPEPPLLLLAPNLAALGITATLVVLAFRRMERTPRETDAAALFFVATYAVPLSLVQLFEPYYHVPVDMLVVPLLAYGLARHQVLDIDLTLKRSLRHGTVAGAFLAVFFVASEVAQQFLGETLGGAYIGIVAAGALVFAISPLQRAAERIADASLPRVSDTPEYREERRESLYRATAEELLADGDLTPKERAALTRLRAQLGLGPREAQRIEDEVARTMATTA